MLTELDPLGPDGIYLILRGLKLCFTSILCYGYDFDCDIFVIYSKK